MIAHDVDVVYDGYMEPLTICDADTIVLALQDEIRRSQEARYDHRLHAILLVAQGMTAPEVARLLGDAPRTVEYWVRQFEDEGLSGLVEGERPGRPPRLNDEQMQEIADALRQEPEAVGMNANLWDGKVLSAFIQREHGIELGVRQCQRLFRQLGFRLRKPRPVIAHADPEQQKAYKKSAETGQ